MDDRSDSKIKIIREKLDKGYLCVVSLQADIRKSNGTQGVIFYKLTASSFCFILKSFYLCVQIFLTCPKTGRVCFMQRLYSQGAVAYGYYAAKTLSISQHSALTVLPSARSGNSCKEFHAMKTEDWRGDSRIFSMM